MKSIEEQTRTIGKEYKSWKQQTAEQYADKWSQLPKETKEQIKDKELEYRLKLENLNQKLEEEQNKKEQFYEARRQAFADLEERHKQEKKELQELWQAKENNGFDINYIPE